jgi:hypothetical protein
MVRRAAVTTIAAVMSELADAAPDATGSPSGTIMELSTCLQNTPRLPVGIAHLGLRSQRVRQDDLRRFLLWSTLVVSKRGSGLLVPKPVSCLR